MKTIVKILLIIFSIYIPQYCLANSTDDKAKLKGKVVTKDNEVIDFATIHLKNTKYGAVANDEGKFKLKAPEGQYTLVVTAIGYQNYEKEITLTDKTEIKVVLIEKEQSLDEVLIVSDGVSRVKKSPYNAIAIDTKALRNTTLSLSDALAKAPGVKVREAGGVGSDMQLMMDGFTGKHIKVFVDGIPQEGVGSSFGLNNIPANYAERIEVYKGVVPVGFGTDAIGGVINVVTKKNNSNKWFADASYSYGSFNTHKSYVNFGQTYESGFTYEVNAFQNYSDNDYKIETSVENFETGTISKSKVEKVKRFHDKYHNEAVLAKLGVINKKWADRLMFGFTYSNMYREIQTGVRQEIVFGDKLQKSHSFMPSLEYSKTELIKNLDVYFTANYNKNIVNNIDTSTTEYNWRGETQKRTKPGEQSYQYLRSYNNNWNGTATANYRIGEQHLFTVNHMYNSFRRSNKSILHQGTEDAIKRETQKNISGLSYRYLPMESLNLSVFGKYYNQHISGPIATSTAQDKFEKIGNNTSKLGYGTAVSYFVIPNLQAKLSYEKAFRLPTIEETFGDEDLETGDIKIKPENSDNFNFNLSYDIHIQKHFILLEGGLIYRDTKDYIQRTIESLGSGRYGAAYENHGKVKTTGYNISLRYAFGNWISLGGSYSELNAKDNVKTISEQSSQENLKYKSRMPNTPYRFANSDITFFWHDLGAKNNLFTFTYDNQYTHSFPLYSEALGSEEKKEVPSQFSHNLRFTYSLKSGKYNLSFECKNFTNEKMYDNFSLQKPGRSFYGKIRVSFGG